MERIPEPELMDDPEQARAYASADFSEPHQAFVERFTQRFNLSVTSAARLRPSLRRMITNPLIAF